MSLYYLVLLMSLICAKGSAMKRLENFRVISYRLVSSDYHYSDERMKWRGKYYMPFLYEEYRKGTLQNVGIYKSEGLLLFTSSEVEKDSLMIEYFSIIKRREVYVGKKVVIDKEGGDKRHVYNTVIVKHRYYCYTGKYLRVYIPDT